MTEEQSPSEAPLHVRRNIASRIVLPIARLPIAFLRFTVSACFHTLWYMAFHALCMFRPFTGVMVLAAIVMLPMSIVVFAHPEAARGMPFWAFLLMSLGFVEFALGYALLVDWVTPPGAEDPFDRYRDDADALWPQPSSS